MSKNEIVQASSNVPEVVDLEAAMEKARAEAVVSSVQASDEVRGDSVAQDKFFTN